MKKNQILAASVLAIVVLLFFVFKNKIQSGDQIITITYPFNNAVFPADIIAPTFRWEVENDRNTKFQIVISKAGSVLLKEKNITKKEWRPSATQWEILKAAAADEKIDVLISDLKEQTKGAQISLQVSSDKVDAPIFFRSVPLPFKFARENLKKIRWHFGEIKNETKPHVVLENIPVCANCHSFTPNGSTIAMDVDARNDKGAYTICSLDEETNFSQDSLIHWSDAQEGKFTYGLLSQISPNGRYVVSTLKDCEIFVDRDDMEYSQLFFPVKGILVIYDRLKEEYFELEGANDTMLIQSNPIWSPDGEEIYFTRALAKHFEESALHNGSTPKGEDIVRYKKFEQSYLSRDSLMKFDIYKIPFNNGTGGKAIPVEGASHNGLSNYFPKISPDGKWLAFCQAESFMLLQKDSKLMIKSLPDGETKAMQSNTNNMNSWHSWSPNSKWLVFSTKAMGPYTQLFLTHINEKGEAAPPVYLENFSFEKYANNIPEFVNTEYNSNLKINPIFIGENDFIIRTGEIKEKEGDIEGAYKAFDKAVKKFPKQAEAYFKRGYISFIKDDILKSILDFNKALEIQEHSDYYTYRGLAYLKLGKYNDVINDLSKASELAPTSFTPYAYIGVAYLRSNQFSNAVRSLEKAVELYQEDDLTYYYLGLANYSLKNWKDAELAITKAIGLGLKNSSRNPVSTIRGEARFYLEDYYGAIEDLSEAVKITTQDSELFFMLGKAQWETGLKKKAKENLLMAKKLGSAKAAKFLAEIR